MRETNDPTSDIIYNLQYGEKVFINWAEESKYIDLRVKTSSFIENRKTPELYLTGRMVNVKYKDKVGYVFSGFLLSFPPFSNEKQFNEFLLAQYDTCKTIKCEDCLWSNQIIFENGIISFGYAPTTGCQENTYILPQFSVQGGFLIAYHILRLGIENDPRSTVPRTWYVNSKGRDFIEIQGQDEGGFFASIRQISNFVSITIGGCAD